MWILRIGCMAFLKSQTTIGFIHHQLGKWILITGLDHWTHDFIEIIENDFFSENIKINYLRQSNMYVPKTEMYLEENIKTSIYMHL